MSRPSMLKKELDSERLPKSNPPRFDRNRLAHELLSLGNPKITSTIARLIAQEVEDELESSSPEALSPEWVSETVRRKLEELGLIEMRASRSRARKQETEKAMKMIHPFTPRNTSARQPAKPPRPTRDLLRWTEEGSRFLASLSLPGFQEEFSPEKFLENFCRTIASVETRYHPDADVESTAIHFYNRLGGLDFLPGKAVFMTDGKAGKSLGAVCGLNLPLSASNLYRSLETLEGQLKDPSQAHSKLTLAFSPTREEPTAEDLKVIELFLKLLKTRLEHHAQATGNWVRQELFLPLPPSSPSAESPSLSSFLIDWVQQPVNRPYFALSYGVTRTRWDGSAAQAEAHLWGSTETRALGSEEVRSQGPASSTLSGRLRPLQRELLAQPTLRLFFSEEKGLLAMGERAVPSPSSAIPHESEALIPSGAVNLSAMVLEEDIDWDRLRRAVRQGVHFLDNVIDLWRYPSEAAERAAFGNRKIALGVMGWADLLYQLRIPYDGEEALDLASKISVFIQDEAVKASLDLAKSRGTFSHYIGSSWQKRGLPVRNAQLTALHWDPVPSNIAQVAPGIEPHAVLVAQEKIGGERPRYLLHPFLASVATHRGLSNERILHKIIEAGSLQRVEEIPEDIRRVFLTTEDLGWERQLSMAQAFELPWDGGVAKLIPLRSPWEEKDLEAVIKRALSLKLSSLWLKRVGEPFEIVPEKEEAAAAAAQEILPPEDTTPVEAFFKEEPEEVTEVHGELKLPPPALRERPSRLQGSTHHAQTTCGRMFITINEDETGPFEIFTSLGKSTGCTPAQNESLSRFVTLSLRAGAPLDEVLKELRESPCAGYRAPRDFTPSCTEAIAEALTHHLPQIPQKTEIENQAEAAHSPPTAECSDCGQPFLKLNGSAACPPCRGESLASH